MLVLYEDDYILVCVKPAGIATQAAKVTQKDMVSEVNNYIKKAGGNPAYLINRLDKPVTGLVLFAKTKEAAGILSESLRNGNIKKHYYALVEGVPENESGELNDFIIKDNKTKKAVIVDEKTDGAKAAKLKYKVADPGKTSALAETIGICDVRENVTLLDIELITGRYHQIRAQLSNIGHPIAGDTLYGAKELSTNNKMSDNNTLGNKNVCNNAAIFLLAYKLTFPHPKTGEVVELEI